MHLSSVLGSAESFEKRLRELKAGMSDISWYPYDSISCAPMLRSLTAGVPISAGNILVFISSTGAK